MKNHYSTAIALAVCLLAIHFPVRGQKNSAQDVVICTKTPTIKGRYRILHKSSVGGQTNVDVEVKPKERTDKNYVAIAKELRERYCKETSLSVLFFRDKQHWLNSGPHAVDNYIAYPIAIFSWSKEQPAEKNMLEVYTVVGGKVETRKVAVPE